MKNLLLVSAFVLVPTMAVSAEVPKDAQDYAIQNEILFLDADGEFRDEQTVTRLEFTLATVDHLYADQDVERCFEELAPSLPVKFRLLFGDVEKDTWYGKRLCEAMVVGLIDGDQDGNFRPFDTITAAEASKILTQAYGLVYPTLSQVRRPWYEGPMLALSMQGALGSQVAPGTSVTRVEMAKMFYALRNTQRYPEVRVIGGKTPSAPSATGDAPATQSAVATPETGTCAAYVQVIQERRGQKVSRRMLRKQVEDAYKNGTPDDPVANKILLGCPEFTVRTPGGALRVLGNTVPRRAEGEISTRALRAQAEYRPHTR